jgi:O-antigen/teichoic acid export membrane protein
VKTYAGWQVLWSHITTTAPFAGILLAIYLSNQVGVVLLPTFAGTEQVGYYAAAARLFDNLTVIPEAIMGAFLPTMSRLYVTSTGPFIRTMHFTLKYLFILSSPLAVGLIILASPITAFLYGEPFAPSAAALRILAPALVFSFWNYMGDCVLIAGNRERLLLRLTWLDAGIHILANLLLIPFFSYLGLCYAILTTQAVRFCILVFALHRYLRARTLLELAAAPGLCTLFMGGAVFVMKAWPLWFVVPAGMVIYIAALFISGTVRWTEMDHLQGTLRGPLTPSLLEP